MVIVIEIRWNAETAKFEIRVNRQVIAESKTAFTAKNYASMLKELCKIGGIPFEYKEVYK